MNIPQIFEGPEMLGEFLDNFPGCHGAGMFFEKIFWGKTHR